MLCIHGTQEGINRGDGDPPDEHDFDVDWKIWMLLQRIFTLTRCQYDRRLPVEEQINIGLICIDTAIDWEKVSEALCRYTAETEEELVDLVRFLDQTVIWGDSGDPKGWHRIGKTKDVHRIWDYYFTEPELIREFLSGRISLPMEAGSMEEKK